MQEHLGQWLRLVGAMRRFADYVIARRDDGELDGKLGLAATVDQFKNQARTLAETEGLADEFNALFTLRDDLSGSAKMESILALLVSMTGWIQGHVDELLVDQRIQAEAEAIAREKTKKVGFA